MNVRLGCLNGNPNTPLVVSITIVLNKANGID